MISIEELQEDPDRYLALAEEGKEILISQNGEIRVKLIPADPEDGGEA